MPWEKSFDVDRAVDKATEAFWKKGFEATSLADLLKATGLTKGSFYNAFGSKKQLFTLSLLKYEREQRRDVMARLESLEDPIGAISQLFDSLIEQSLADPEKKGCFLVNTALDMPNLDSDIGDAVKKGLRDTESFFARQVRLGIEKGVISDRVDPEVCANSLLTLLVGLRVLARGVFNKGSLSRIKVQALDLLR
ncbi:TetR/AcrR family transcriptional regulator [Microbulbifer sp. SSSA008]|uniref:TetR/AcrR family transcriptional regulator n=1 Tax=Microbulbifer sp. SSSA008 TaxID=3243380 RepID=UPI0040396190